MSELVKVTTEHSAILKVLFDVLKDVLPEFKMEFVQNPTDLKKKVAKKTVKQVKTVKKTVANKKKKNDSSSSSDSSDSETSESEEEGESEEEDKEEAKKQSGGIRILELDPHQTLLIYVKLNAEHFSEFYVKYPVYSVGLDLIKLHKYLKTIDKESILTLSVDKDDEQNILFEAHNDTKKCVSSYKQKLMDLDDVNKKLPHQTKFEIMVTMDTSEFHKLCREMHQFSDHIEITCTKKEITFKCHGDSNVFFKKFSNSDKNVKITCLAKDDKKPIIVQAIYELSYLVTFGKCQGLCPDLQLYLKNDFPLFIHYQVAILGKMLIGLTPVDEKAIKKENDYDETNDKFYDTFKKVEVKK